VRATATIALVLLAACGSDADRSAATSAPVSSTSTTPTTVLARTTSTSMLQVGEVTLGATTRPPDDLGDVLPDGRWYGFLRGLDLERAVAAFDVAQWLVLDDATAAAIEDGQIAEGDTVPNDHYVRNESSRVRDVPLADDVVVTVARCPSRCGQFLGDLAGLAASFDTGERLFLDAPYRGEQSSYWLTIVAGQVTGIDEQYVP
jgi:hypothetical protein